MSQEQEKTKLVELVQSFENGFLVTRTPDGSVHGRPMALAQVRENGTLYFAADADSPKVRELENDAGVGVFFQGPNRWVAITGVAVVVHDRELVDELWSETWKVWFPQGKSDPRLCLIEVIPQFGEYWDQSGTEGVPFVFETVKAYLTGTKPELDRSLSGKVAL